MTTLIPETDTKRPEPKPVRSSVLDHATVVTTPVAKGFGMRTEVGMWPSYNCLETFTHTPMCPDPPGKKTFDTVGRADAFSFAVYAGVECRAIGLDTADQDAEILRVFERNEGKGVEEALLKNRFAERTAVTDDGVMGTPRTSDGRPLAEWDAPTDLTAGMDLTTVTPKLALAMVEGYARTIYAGVPTIHMPAGMAGHLCGEGLVWEGSGDNMYAVTHLGSKIACAGGYDPDYTDTTWRTRGWTVYATGEVYIEKSTEIKESVYDLPGGRDGAANAGRNHYLSLVERMYRASVDCFVASATSRKF